MSPTLKIEHNLPLEVGRGNAIHDMTRQSTDVLNEPHFADIFIKTSLWLSK